MSALSGRSARLNVRAEQVLGARPMWNDYGPSDRLRDQVAESTRQIVKAQAASAGAVVASAELVNEGLDNIAHTLDSRLQGVEDELGLLAEAVDSGFANVAYCLRMQSEQLASILATLQAPLSTQARELVARAQLAYLNGWTAEAKTDYGESVRLNPYDFSAHFVLGNIALVDDEDFKTAAAEFELSAKYAEPYSKRDVCLALLGASDAYCRMSQFSEALEAARAALAVVPGLPEGRYSAGRALSGLGEPLARNELLEAFRWRPRLTVRSMSDSTLDKHPVARDAALEEFRDELRGLATVWQMGMAEVVRHGAEGLSACGEPRLSAAVSAVESGATEAAARAARHSIADYLDAIALSRERVQRFRTEAAAAVQDVATRVAAINDVVLARAAARTADHAARAGRMATDRVVLVLLAVFGALFAAAATALICALLNSVVPAGVLLILYAGAILWWAVLRGRPRATVEIASLPEPLTGLPDTRFMGLPQRVDLVWRRMPQALSQSVE